MTIPKTGLCVVTSIGCGPCIRLKDFLKKSGVPFTERDANKLPPELKPMIRGGVPIILKDGAPLMTKDKRIVTSGTIPYGELLGLVT